MEKKMGRRRFFKRGASAAVVGVTAAACSTGENGTEGLAGPSPIAEGDRRITVVAADDLAGDALLVGARVRVGEPVSLERTTNDDGTVVVSVSGATALSFDTPLDNRCVPFRTSAGNASEFCLRLRAFGDITYLSELHGGFVRRSIRPWHVKCSGELWNTSAARESIEEVVAYLNTVLRGFCTITVGMGVPRDVSLVNMYIDTSVQYGAVANKEPAGGNIVTGGTVRFPHPGNARYQQLVLHELTHLIIGGYHVASVRSIMNVGEGPNSMYTYAHVSDDVALGMAIRTAYRRTPGTGFVGDGESDRGAVVMSASAEGGEEIMCTYPPLRA